MNNEEFTMEVETERLNLNSYLHAAADFESARHHIPAGLKTYRSEVDHSRLFPAFSEMIELKKNLCTLLDQHEEFIHSLPRDIDTLDWKHTTITCRELVHRMVFRKRKSSTLSLLLFPYKSRIEF